MATVSSDIRKIKLDKLRHAILSYKPGRAVPCDDKLAIGIIRVHPFGVNVADMVPALRRALHGDEEPSISTEDDDQEKYLTDSISVINKKVLGLYTEERNAMLSYFSLLKLNFISKMDS